MAARQSSLLAPDVARMAVIEKELSALEPLLRVRRAAMEIAISHRDAIMDRLWLAEDDGSVNERIRAELATADDAWRAAINAWRAVDEPAFALRDEWLQLQVVRNFLPRCTMCERVVGPTYLEMGGRDYPPTLCMGCFDGWACDYDPESDRQPPSYWIELTAQEARERETARRVDQAGPHLRSCWHCGESVNDLRDADGDYLGAQVVLRVAALVPRRTSPEIGEVCLLCVDPDTELFGRWAEIEWDLRDPGRLRHERALYRFVRDGLLQPGGEPRVFWDRSRGAAAMPAAARPQPSPSIPRDHRFTGPARR